MFELNANFATLADDALAEYAAQVRAAIKELLAVETPTEEQLATAEQFAAHFAEVQTLQTTRTEAAAALVTRREALAAQFADDPEEDPADDPDDPDGDDPADDPEEDPDPAPETGTAQARSNVATLAGKTKRPRPPASAARKPITITAAADVPGFATSSEMADMSTVAAAVINRTRGFGVPSGDGKSENWQHYGVAQFRMDFPDELTIKSNSEDEIMEVLERAAKEARLPGNSLVASGGWCAPSEVLYDLCTTATTDGILSVPEVSIKRGGIKYPTSPDFSTVYGQVGFSQTEAQAISGTTKPCFEVPCPTWNDVRLDAKGLCLRVPILTNVGYPEIVKWYLDNSMIAHQHKVNASVIGSMVTAAGTARVPGGALGATATDTLDALVLYADQQRQKYRMALNATMEVVLPFFVQDILRADMSRRTGMPISPVTDAVIAAEFAARKLKVSYVYDWQNLTVTDNAWPATFQVLMYPAGAFVKGTADVINLNAVYDAASLATNIYTGLFFEEGVLVAKMCQEAVLVTMTVCNAGRTGAANFTCS